MALAVGCVAAAMLLFEIIVTRLFSVLFFYHFSFFAVSLVMSGLVFGGLLAARWNAPALSRSGFEGRLAMLALLFSAGTVLSLAAVVWVGPTPDEGNPSALRVAVHALAFLPGLVAGGAFLALAFARNRAWIGRLYAWDLAAAAAACLGSIAMLRLMQGPPALLLPAVLAGIAAALLGPSRAHRAGGVIAALFSCLLGAGNAVTGYRMLRLGPSDSHLLYERWNEHSRVIAAELPGVGRYLLIDRIAGTLMFPTPRSPEGGPPKADVSWAKGQQYIVYHLARPVRRVAIIGVGGGSDLRPALYWGAERVDGYELNQIFVDLLQHDFSDYNALAARPEVRLHHTEARVGIARSGERYDVIQASLIDTWAATASGGFVLSENGLYTREGWHTFLRHLTDTGVLSVTRWHIPEAPAETERLVSLAAAALSDEGFEDAASHVILMRANSDGAIAFTGREGQSQATILVSRTPFTRDEVERLRQAGARDGMSLAAAPGLTPEDDVVRQILSPSGREQAIAASPFDIAPPTDARPFFFLQIRPSDWLNLSRDQFGTVTQITFNGVRVLMMLCGLSLLFVAGVVLFALSGLPGASSSPPDRRRYRWMTLYFLGIGLGYILVQLGLHQRLIISLGHPTLALAVVLTSMLLGSGAGSVLSERFFPRGDFGRAFAAILGVLGLSLVLLRFAAHLEDVSVTVRLVIVAIVVAVVGFVLGFAFPLGVRRVASTGEWATQKMWAINGAASIAGSVLAALIGLTLGSAGVLATGMAAYGLAAFGGIMAARGAADTRAASG